jgi:hypothetical protein
MNDPVRARRRSRDAGLAAVRTWTRRAVAGGVVLAGLLGAGLAHLLPGQAAVVGHDAPAPTGSPASPDPTGSPASPDPTRASSDQGGASSDPGGSTERPTTLAPPSAVPRPSHHHPHVTSGGS